MSTSYVDRNCLSGHSEVIVPVGNKGVWQTLANVTRRVRDSDADVEAPMKSRIRDEGRGL
jgi:hypothetical protein